MGFENEFWHLEMVKMRVICYKRVVGIQNGRWGLKTAAGESKRVGNICYVTKTRPGDPKRAVMVKNES